ncbi:MAG: alpha/beta hydrolase-fold protein, partial [Bacteroidota bacterium]|nr:alpha/beta hydrolase-fold protein [Bacteroidota bacterium]
MTHKIQFAVAGVLIFLIQLFNPAIAEDLPGKRDSVYSAILNQNRIFQVLVPEDYKPGSTDKFDVLYLLDGESNINLFNHVERFMREDSFIPHTIVVAIHNIDRNKDFTPTHLEGISNSGGAENFLAFIKNELVPYINKTYPANGDNILYGHSFGGVFAMYALLMEPELFQSYIAIDPSFWWDNQYLQKLTAEKVKAGSNFNKTLFIAGREGGDYKGMGIASMDSVLKATAPKNLNWKSVAYANESHNSIRYKSIYDALKFNYTGYNSKVEFHPMNGIVLKNKPFKVWAFTDHPLIRYTSNGSEPDSTSLKVEQEINLSGPAILKIRTFSSSAKHDKTSSGNYTEGKAFPATSKPKNATSGGFNYSYYEGEWDKLPNFKTLKALKTGIADSTFNIKMFGR